MKKLAVFMLAALMMLTLPCLTAFAADTIDIIVSSAAATAGEDVQITVTVENNPGICALGFVIPYDKDGLTLVSAEYTDLFGEITQNIYNDGKALYFNIAKADNVYANGIIAKLTFHVNDSFDTSYTLTPSLRAENGFILHANADHSLTDVTLKVGAGTLTVKGNISIPTTDPVTEPTTECVHANTEEIIKTEPSCTAEGKSETCCSDCGEVLSENIVPMTEHSYGEWTVTKEPTAKEAGKRTRTCIVCSDSISELIPKLSDDNQNEQKGSKGLIFGIIAICFAIIVAVSIVYKRFGKKGIDEPKDADNDIDDDTDNKYIVS